MADAAEMQRLYDALNAAMALGDEASIARLLGPVLTDDIELYPSETLLDGRECHGVGEVVDWLATVSMSGVRWKLDSIEDQPDGTVVTRGMVEGQGTTSGAASIASFEHRVTLRDGRIARLDASIRSNLG